LGKIDYKDYLILDLVQPHENKREPDITCDLNIGEKGLSYSDKEKIQDGFDVVFCLEVMEYIYNPVVALSFINSLLKKDGIAYFSFQFLYPVHNPVDCDFLRYTKSGMTQLLNKSGFEIVEITERIMKPQSCVDYNEFMINEGFKAAKTINHFDTGYLVKAKKI
jgi:SAM-dependent methyltransferase